MIICIFLYIMSTPPISTLFPYTTLFRSVVPEDLSIPPREEKRESRNLSDSFPYPKHRSRALFGNRVAFEWRSEEHTSELQSHSDLVCRLLLEKKKKRCKVIKTSVNQLVS